MYQDYKAAWAQLTAPGADFEVATANVRGNDIRTYANAPESLRDVWLSTTAFADRDYLVYNDERLTYGEAHQRVASAATGSSHRASSPVIGSLLPCVTTLSGCRPIGR